MNVMRRDRCIILVLIFTILSLHALPSNSKTLNIAVVGAGVSGLCSAKNALEQGHNVVVYEKSEALGGTWYYTNKTGKDEYGINIYTAMYQVLRTNTPRQIMELPGLQFPKNTPSYPPHEDIWNYLNSYADRFGLKKHIKFHHLVEKIHSIENDQWKIIVKDLPNNKTRTMIYDAVFISIDKLSTLNYPQYEGANEFNGKIMHSHEYRRAEDFHGADVLVIGSGSSGSDIIFQLSKTANRVTWSKRTYTDETEEERKVYGETVTFKNNVKLLTSSGAEFLDGTHQNFTVIIYATGYKNSFSILDADTGLRVDDNYVQPLYKQIINIEHPTMALISIDTFAANFRVKDLQVRFALEFFSGAKKLPPKSEMLKDMQDFAESQQKKGHYKSRIHIVGIDDSKEYYGQVSQAADLAKILDVYPNIASDSMKTSMNNPFGFREFKYTIIDDETFEKKREV
ncbi:senecionine N-oxygenase-like [Contarinia nasturtii]|uniref:senecionine N-oxygenase-like n=1 Tax=Contarinia nasturtii TaxID=265458 RepID=UPI0012D4477C|nr:senecionine N-oxygenase-like [Contarinia nasturtii]